MNQPNDSTKEGGSNGNSERKEDNHTSHSESPKPFEPTTLGTGVNFNPKAETLKKVKDLFEGDGAEINTLNKIRDDLGGFGFIRPKTSSKPAGFKPHTIDPPKEAQSNASFSGFISPKFNLPKDAPNNCSSTSIHLKITGQDPLSQTVINKSNFKNDGLNQIKPTQTDFVLPTTSEEIDEFFDEFEESLTQIETEQLEFQKASNSQSRSNDPIFDIAGKEKLISESTIVTSSQKDQQDLNSSLMVLDERSFLESGYIFDSFFPNMNPSNFINPGKFASESCISPLETNNSHSVITSDHYQSLGSSTQLNPAPGFGGFTQACKLIPKPEDETNTLENKPLEEDSMTKGNLSGILKLSPNYNVNGSSQTFDASNIPSLIVNQDSSMDNSNVLAENDLSFESNLNPRLDQPPFLSFLKAGASELKEANLSKPKPYLTPKKGLGANINSRLNNSALSSRNSSSRKRGPGIEAFKPPLASKQPKTIIPTYAPDSTRVTSDKFHKRKDTTTLNDSHGPSKRTVTATNKQSLYRPSESFISRIYEYIENKGASRECLLNNLVKLSGKPLHSYSRKSLVDMGLNSVLNIISITSAKEFRFQTGVPGRNWGCFEAGHDLESSLQLRASPSDFGAWVENHYGQIVWKLACQVKNFPHQMKDFFKPSYVSSQLEVRFYRENVLKESSTIKAIVEGDSTSSRYFVAVVSQIELGEKENIYITDGWYQIKCSLDLPLQKALNSKRLSVGQKLGIYGAQLNSPGPMPVLESEGVVTMRLFGNSTRIARWNADLGFKSCPRFLTCIKNINLEGGTIPCFEAVVVRKYGLKFMTQQDKSGTKVVRSYEEERDYRTNSETRVEAQLHEFPSIPFFAVRIADLDGNEALLTVWNSSKELFDTLNEGNIYQFTDTIPGKPNTKYDEDMIKLTATKTTIWIPVKDSHKVEQAKLLVRTITPGSELIFKAPDAEVDLMVVYLGEFLNGFTFYDVSGKFIVIKPPAFKSDTFRLLKPRNVVIIENAVVGPFHRRFNLQDIRYGLNLNLNIKGTTVEHKEKMLAFATEIEKKGAEIDKALEDTILYAETNRKPIQVQSTFIVEGKFNNWEWAKDHHVRAQFQADQVQYDVDLPPSQWRQALALNLRGTFSQKLIKYLKNGDFINARVIREPSRSQYLKLRDDLSKYRPYPLSFNLMCNLDGTGPATPSKKLLKAKLGSAFKHEQFNLKSFFSKRIALDTFKINLAPLHQPANNSEQPTNLYRVERVSLPRVQPTSAQFQKNIPSSNQVNLPITSQPLSPPISQTAPLLTSQSDLPTTPNSTQVDPNPEAFPVTLPSIADFNQSKISTSDDFSQLDQFTAPNASQFNLSPPPGNSQHNLSTAPNISQFLSPNAPQPSQYHLESSQLPFTTLPSQSQFHPSTAPDLSQLLPHTPPSLSELSNLNIT